MKLFTACRFCVQTPDLVSRATRRTHAFALRQCGGLSLRGLLLAAVMTFQTSAETPAPIIDGAIYRFSPLLAPELALQVQDGDTASGAKVQIGAASTNALNQQWQAVSLGANVWQFTPLHAPGLRLHVPSLDAGTEINQATASSDATQCWTAIANTDGSYSFAPVAAPAQRLDVPDGADGTRVQIHASNDGTRLANISSRGRIESGARQMIVGVVVAGNGSSRLLVRGIGPALQGVLEGFLPNPAIALWQNRGGNQTQLETNEDWWNSAYGTQTAELAPILGAGALPPLSRDAAILTRLTPGIYTAIISGDSDSPGVAIAEIYEAYTANVPRATATPPQVLVPNGDLSAKIVNLSTRGIVGTGENVLIAGFVISGPSHLKKNLLVRASGLNLKAVLPGAIGRPRMRLFRNEGGGQTLLAQNSDWQENRGEIAALTAQLGASPFAVSANPAEGDAAMVLNLAAGVYTVVVDPDPSSANQNGVSLIELYDATAAGTNQRWKLTAKPGSYKPSSSTTGVRPGVVLQVVTGNTIVTTSDTTYEGIDFRGKVSVQAANVTFRNCKFSGNPSNPSGTELVNAGNAKVVNLVIEDCTFLPQAPSQWVNGMIGHDFTLRRCDVSLSTDGVNIYNSNNPHGAVNVYLEANYIHDLAFWSPAQTNSDGKTHNDGSQIQGGANINYVGNFITGLISPTVGNPDKGPPGLQANAALMIQPIVGNITELHVVNNWLGGGAVTVNFSNVTARNLGNVGDVSNNKFGRNQTYQGDAALPDDSGTITMPSNATVTTVGNVYEDDGHPVVVRRNW
ncbi:MAG: RICIN domain-containing protein [Opitutae bacterium]|nr:RICIN domain-containing protein [Opitutae bacterium]